MKHYEDRDRTASLKRIVPDLFDYKSVLYVGARTDRFDYGNSFKEKGYDITVIEIFEDNINYLKKIPWLKEVIAGDIRTFSTDKKFDVSFWWHGPEHIKDYELRGVVDNLKKITNKLIVFGCPWGRYELGALYNNPYERHITHWDYTSFEEMGFEVECLGTKDVPLSNITSVMRLN